MKDGFVDEEMVEENHAVQKIARILLMHCTRVIITRCEAAENLVPLGENGAFVAPSGPGEWGRRYLTEGVGLVQVLLEKVDRSFVGVLRIVDLVLRIARIGEGMVGIVRPYFQ